MEDIKKSQNYYHAVKRMDKSGLDMAMMVGAVWDDLVEPLEISFNRRSSCAPLIGRLARDLIQEVEKIYDRVKDKRGEDWSDLALLPLTVEWARVRFAPLNPYDFRRSLIVFITLEEFAEFYEYLSMNTFTGLISGL